MRITIISLCAIAITCFGVACGTARRLQSDQVRDVFSISVVVPPDLYAGKTGAHFSATVDLKEHDRQLAEKDPGLLADLKYYWEFGAAAMDDTSHTSTSESQSPTATIGALNTTGYECKLTVWSREDPNLRSEKTFNVPVQPRLQIQLEGKKPLVAPTQVQAEGTVTFTVLTSLSGAPGSLQYLWDFGGLGICANASLANPVVNIRSDVPVNGPVKCRVTVSTGGQTDHADFEVTVQPKPSGA